MPATLFPDRASRERSVSVLSDRSYQSATESKLDAYARYYGISTAASRASVESDYSNEYVSSSKRLSRISEDRRTTDREYSVASGASADYSKALIASSVIDSRSRSKTPFIDLSRQIRDRPAAYDYSSFGTSNTEGLYDVLSYTRNVLSLMGTDGNVRVNMTYRPTPPVYNYTPTHKHYHVSAPNNYYVTQAAPPQPAYQAPAPIYHHHHHYPSRSVTTTTTRRFYLPYRTAAAAVNTTLSGETSTEYDSSSSSALYRRSNRAVSEFRERDTSSAQEALDYRRSGRAASEFREASTGADYGYSGYSGLSAGSGDYRAKSRSRARSVLSDYDLYDSKNRKAKLEAALEEDEENYRRRIEARGGSVVR